MGGIYYKIAGMPSRGRERLRFAIGFVFNIIGRFDYFGMAIKKRTN
jgi:hypothetical protein